MNKKFFLAAIVAATMAVNVGYSQSASADQKEEAVAPSKEMQTFVLAGQLAKHGYEENSVTALIQAAELYLSLGERELKAVSVEAGTGKATTKNDKVSHDPKRILADAKKMAAGDPVYLAMIAKVEDETRGGTAGPQRAVHKVEANSADRFTLRFIGNERAVVVVSGDGDTDLDLYVYDGNGNLIAKDEDYSDDCVASWIPSWTGNFTIRVVNRGGVYNRYVIATN